VLVELDIRDLAITEHVRVAFGPGLTAITGETGAGKSLIIDALQLLLGGRADPALVRAGADSARVEGVFDLGAQPLPEPLRSVLGEVGVEPDDGTLIVSREIAAGPRSRATGRINGRAVVQSALAAIGAQLVEIHGQGEHVQLLATARHAVLLDRFAGALPQKAALARPLSKLRELRAELTRLQSDERERARREERLRFELAEISGAELRPEEEDELQAERLLLGNAERLAELADAGHAALQGGARGGSAVDALGRASEALAELAELDPRLAEDALTASTLQEQAIDLARTLRSYRESVEHNPRRLTQVEERLTLLATLQRKYGATLAEVIAYGAEIAGELATLESSEERRAELLEQERALMAEAADRAAELSAVRVVGALRLVGAVRAELLDLGLPHARFAVQFSRRAANDGLPCDLPLALLVEDTVETTDNGRAARLVCDAGGVDRIEFLVTLNPGEPLRPLARVASGGETSRLMLALETVLGDAADVATMIFDEIEQGIGGRSGGVVGAKLAALGESRQVVCITHLPQIAARAQQHLVVSKAVAGERTRTAVLPVEGEARTRELAAMLGGETPANLDSANDLLRTGAAGRSRAATR
jgi:DNA repair protein RecN (Recombination protein N)